MISKRREKQESTNKSKRLKYSTKKNQLKQEDNLCFILKIKRMKLLLLTLRRSSRSYFVCVALNRRVVIKRI
jgi:hypothetical protein